MTGTMCFSADFLFVIFQLLLKIVSVSKFGVLELDSPEESLVPLRGEN